MKLLNSVIILSSLGFMAPSYGEVGFDKSADIADQSININVGASQSVSTFHPAPVGSPGIGVSAKSDGMRIGFKGLISSPRYTMPQDAYNMYDTSLVPGPHGNIGHYRFAKINDEEIYFGEWTYQQDDTAYRNVYYAGQDITTDMPSEGSAIYTTSGISAGYAENGPIMGSLSADFAQNTLQGDLTNGSLTLNIDAAITNNSATFAGAAKISHDSNQYSGDTSGKFFNDQASSLAGIATFTDNREYDASFAGKKQ
ncbi:Slam-dependent surface lipoprotein [Moellerella wisconsensis]|uniref:Transferrin-binding protein-like solute binding protein n=2 Tax=Moellerella wisconsensis TaxID=158849 RepID=A0ACD3Y7E4_9GAMM|nr:Slam-dependent surface lipoprotein [Moellerella wisconsensis]UNH24187.1 transferrin-binding protein-like solute binding protein [Moellerella wisconsensis]UNH27271.1 transferrin-binding protein-like solute binding protein [Moellerella wisconsensis]UNH30745.1 transferrin-binding protein-like solute binding protein [Moellerella wisconsensis]UNH38905.1 transferrin-binding protein-like solute binding protein [Moellerella wisconsensis]UNH42426.1 transferrin-binding protein-like solute binding pro